MPASRDADAEGRPGASPEDPESMLGEPSRMPRGGPSQDPEGRGDERQRRQSEDRQRHDRVARERDLPDPRKLVRPQERDRRVLGGQAPRPDRYDGCCVDEPFAQPSARPRGRAVIISQR
jgi:hypothetical protein